MTRRALPWRALLLSAAVALLALRPAAARAPRRTMAVTLDDLPWVEAERPDDELARGTAKLVYALRTAGAPATGFVNEDKLHAGGDPQAPLDPRRVALLRQWLRAGLDLGNHTFGHLDLDEVGVAAYERAILQGEEVLRPLLATFGLVPRFFRHPYLHTGRTYAVEDELRAFLAAHGYRVAPVTVDNSDWIFAHAYANALQRGDRLLARRVGDEYVAYMEHKLLYWEAQSRALFGREPPQILLVHASALNADRFGALARGMRRHGYRFVSLETALADPFYREPDGYAGPGGISRLHRWALGHGKPVLPDEPVTPQWVMQAAGVTHE